VDAIAAAQALSEIGYLLRHDPDEKFRAKAFSGAAWSLAIQRPDLAKLQREGGLTSIEGVGAGIAKVLTDLLENGRSRYLERLREQMKQPARGDESALDFAAYRGDVHSHSTWSDGKATMLEMAEGARAMGYRYLGVTDHSPRITVVHGLNAERLVAQSREMAAVQAEVEEVTLLQGIEVDILEDGSLDLPDAVLEILDVVIASPHVKLRQEPAAMTERMMKAVSHPHVDVIGHPTGRIQLRRDAYGFDMHAVLAAAAKHKVAMELNSYPDRLDLNDVHLRQAKQQGVKSVINTDSHHTSHMEKIRYGVLQARRAWLTKDDVLNTLPAARFAEAMEHKC